MKTMMRSNNRQALHSAALSAAGGALWIVGGVLGGASGRWSPPAVMLVSAALPLLAVALLGIAARLRARPGVAIRPVRFLALAGAGLALLARSLDLAVGAGASGPLFGLGTLLFSSALIILGCGALRSADGAGWEGLLVLIGLIGLFLPVGAGVAGTAGLAAWIVWGLGWICAGNVLWQLHLAGTKPFTRWSDTFERIRK